MKNFPDRNWFLNGVKVVGFDFDNTLVDESASFRMRWNCVLDRHKYKERIPVDKLLPTKTDRGVKYIPHVAETLHSFGLSEQIISVLIRDFLEKYSDEEYVYEGAHNTIKALKDVKRKAGIITDGIKSYQEVRIKKAGLYELFDFFYYGDNYQKPDCNMFFQCVTGESIEPSELLYVGDDIIKDIEGVLSLGAKAIWISGESEDMCPEGVMQFNTMNDFNLWLTQR